MCVGELNVDDPAKTGWSGFEGTRSAVRDDSGNQCCDQGASIAGCLAAEIVSLVSLSLSDPHELEEEEEEEDIKSSRALTASRPIK